MVAEKTEASMILIRMISYGLFPLSYGSATLGIDILSSVSGLSIEKTNSQKKSKCYWLQRISVIGVTGPGTNPIWLAVEEVKSRRRLEVFTMADCRELSSC